MANNFLKGRQIVNAALGLARDEVTISSLVWRDGLGDFAGQAGDTITVRIPATTRARTRALRGARPTASEGNGIITMDELSENSFDVTLDTDVYNAIPVTDEELTLDITDFGAQILQPQVAAVVEGVEDMIVAEMVGATYTETLTLNTANPYNTAVDANTALNSRKIPRADRCIVLGAELEGYFLKSDKLSNAHQSGSTETLRAANIGTLSGFPVYVSNAIPADVGFAFHRTAFISATRAPAVPSGATFGASQSYGGLALRWLRDYDFRNVQDRSLVDVFAGTSTVLDDTNGDGTRDALIRAIKIVLPAG
ncbi:P22 phage major capsid protein family protein [Kineococcus radiotolerans]|uniref:Uncharacterized protein n=1 Tax=Kineococcus radiotolerans (strain ATCC BAA-149 / DSM 14245 / SRS30216) TaxID=266940 RepID=A6W8R6_KINRD|nr:P22 phage major capsid protein family protein [Kineococcus radiotolerans]ABS03205.1 hypothetical protein Krad_1719 [Kineococcus radiotolerans SRS30216 = ATCC BAA-149]